MPEIGEIVSVDPFAAPTPSSGGGPQIGDIVTEDPFAPQTNIWGEIAEVGRGIPAGAVQAAGTALRGLAANQPTQRYAGYLDEIEHGVRYRTREREGRLPISDDTAYTDILQRIADDPGMFQSQQLWLRHAIEGVRSGNLEALATARSKLPPEAVQERELWRAGEAVSEFAQENFPAAPGYEDTLGRAVGEGLGSLGAGLVTAVVPGVGSGLSTAFFTAMGSGEAADRAVAAGATDEQIIEAAGLGAGAGATDILPAEMLLGRIPGANVIANAVKRYGGKRTMQALGRISNQAIVESVQEGGQQTLQNLIAQEVYDPEQQLLEGVVENAGVGGIVGGIAGLGREGVYQLSTRRSGSARGDRARAVREVPPPSPADEASPIPTADIIEGRERIADAEATEAANKYLEVAGLPQIGQPVRVARGRDVIEGVVSDAWEGDDPGVTVRAVDGTETDLSLAQMQAMGATLTGLPMPAPRADIERKANEIAQDAQQVREDLAQAEAAATQTGAVEPGRRSEIDQIMADVRRDVQRRTSEPERPPRPPADLPRLTREQSEEVARLITSGMPAAQAVAQVQRGAPSGTAPVDETVTGFGDRPPPRPPEAYGEPVMTPGETAGGFGERPPPRPPPSYGEPVVDPGQTAAGFGDRPAPRPPADFGQPVISTEATQTGFGDTATDPMRGTGPRTRAEVVGPGGRPDDTGPETRPVVVGPGGRPETSGPDSRPLVIGPSGFVETGGGPDTRPLVIGPDGRVETGGPDSRPIVVGPSGRLEAQGPETRPQVTGPLGRDDTAGPPTRPVVIGPSGRMETAGPDSRPIVVGRDGFASAMGPDTRPEIVGPGGRPEEDVGPPTRPAVVGPQGRRDPGGPETRPRVGERERWLQQAIAEATGRDVNETRALAEAVSAATGQDIDRRRALAEAIATAEGGEITESRALAFSVAEATGQDFDQSRAIAQWVAEATGGDMDQRRALAEAVEAASGKEFTPRRALAEAVAAATGRDIDETRGFAQDVARMTGRDVDMRRALAQAIAEDPGRDVNEDRALAFAVAEATGRDLNEARSLAQDVAAATGRDIDRRRALAEAISESTGQDIDERRALAEAVATATGRDLTMARAIAEDVSRLTGEDMNMRRALAQAVEEASGTDITPRRALAEAIATATGRDIDQARGLAQAIDEATGRDVDARRALAQAIAESSGRDIPRERAEALAADDRRQTLTFEALPRKPTAAELNQAAQDEGVPAETAAQVADQVSDALRGPEDAAPTVDMVTREVAATGLPDDFAERIARKVAERQGMLPAPLERRDVPQRPVPEGIPERPPPERAALPEPLPRRDLPQTREPRGLPEGFDERQEVARAAVEAARAVRLPEGARERLAARVEELVEPPDVDLGDAAVFDARVAERLRDIPEVRTLPPAERERFVAEVRGIPEDVRRRMEERDAAPRPEARTIPERDIPEARPPEGLPEGFAERIAEKVAEAPEARRLPVGFADRIAERVAAIPDVQRLDTMDLAERIADMPELEGIPPDVRNRMAARTAVETMRIPPDVRARMEDRQPVATPEGLPEGFDERQEAAREAQAERLAAVPEIPVRAPVAESEALPPALSPEVERAEGEAALSRAAPPPPIMRKDGQPYATEKSAALAARTRGIAAEPVEVTGGWALQQAMPAEPTQETGIPVSREDQPVTPARTEERVVEAAQLQREQDEAVTVYHGQRGDDALRLEDRGDRSILWGTTDQATAERYARFRPDKVTRLSMRLRNPLVVDAQGGRYDEITNVPGMEPGKRYAAVEVARHAREEGHDGLVIENVRITPGGDGPPTTAYAAFREAAVARADDTQVRGAEQTRTPEEVAADEVVVLEGQEAMFQQPAPDPEVARVEVELRRRQDATPGTPQFDRWFRGSKAVDQDGQPQLVYHATDAEERFARFDPDRRGQSYGDAAGFFFASDPGLVEGFGGRLSSGYLSIKNPLVLDAGKDDPVEFWFQNRGAFTQQMEEDGHDGVIVRGEDFVPQEGDDPSTVNAMYVARSPDQIRSAEPDARWQRGATPQTGAQQAPSSRVRIRLNRRYDEAREGVRGDLERIGRETFGQQFRFEIAESITAPEGGQVPGAFDPVNRVAYIALRADEAGMTGSLYHEGLHYLRNAGAFDKADGTPNAAWQTLERQAAQWRQDYGIDERYAGDVGAMDPEARERLLNEEAIAEALADYATRGRETGFGPTVRMALNRILRFFRAMREGLSGRGFQTWEDVFEADIGRGRAGEQADAAQAPSRAELDRQLQTAWHGSPHRFDEFSTDAIGTGEGAQVYGWGLYFADKRGVAEWYQENFSPGATVTFGDREFELDTQPSARYADNAPARAALREAGLTEAGADQYISALKNSDSRDVSGAGQVKALQALQRYANDLRRDQARMEARNFHEEDVRSVRELATAAERDVQIVDDLMARGAIRTTPKKAPLYRVDLAPKNSEYLYWDRRLDLQPKKVRKALSNLAANAERPSSQGFPFSGGRAAAFNELKTRGFARDEDGAGIYRQLSRLYGSDRAASEALLAEGVRGIKYLDQSSRPIVGALGRARMPLRETFNYVIFDDSDVAIQEIMLQRRRAGQGDLALGDDPRQTELPGTERLSEAGVSAARARDREQSEEMLVDVFGEDAVRRSDKLRSDKPQRGVEDLALFSGQRTLFQRGAKEDPKAFDKEASDWSGVDLTGAAEEVVKDKDRMGGFAEEVKAGLKGTTAIQDPAVTVQEEKTHKDLNLAWRFLAPPLAWSKKYPAIHKLIRQGVDTEKEMSNRIQRLNRDWDRVTKKLSKDEFAQLTGILFLGDAEAITFTDEQLGRFNTTEKVRAAYKESRKFLDKIGRFTEQHERAMALPLLTRRTTLVRQMAGERGMDKAEFRALYNARAELLGKQRRGEGHPQAIAFEIAEATESLFGGREAPSALFEDRLKEADRLETRIADTKVRRREGYVPHKFFGRWRIFQAAQPNDEIEPYMGRGGTGFKDRKAAEKVAEASEGGILEGATPVQVDGKWGLEPKWKEVAGEHGLWKTRTDAVRAASHMARGSPDAEIRVVPVEFEFPHDSATTLGDAAYFTFRSKVEELTGLSGEALQEFVTGVARRPFRRRIAGFLQYRTGMTGYSLDLDRVMRTHVGEAVRYISLDRLKFDAINTMEKEGLSAYRSSIQDRPVLAAAVQAWFRDVNGQKQTLEGQIDNVLNKSWVTPLRAGLAAGALGFLAAGGPFNAPISPIVGAYVGYRVGRGLAQGGDFKTRAITGAMLGDMAHLKLGAVFNLMSALVNTSQVPLNTLPVLGVRDTTEGMIRYQKAVLSKLRGKPNADWRFLERMDINPLDTFAEGTRHKFQKEPLLSKISMVFFTTAEGFNRGVTALGAMNKAQRKGWYHKRAKDFANETLDRTQFHYGASDKPELLRNVLLRVPLQFKNFVAHQLAFVFGLNRKELPLFLLSMGLTAGALGIPGLDFVDTLTDWLFDFSPIAMMKEAALDAAVEGELEGGIATFLTRGVPGLAGVDMTGRVGMGDKFLPMQFRDWTGPWVSTVQNAVRHGREGAHWTHQMRNLSPGLGNPLVVLDAWQNGGQVRSPWKRNRPEYVATETELLQKLAGARPIREARLQDLRDVERRAIERYRTDTRRYVDRIVAALDRGDREAARAVMQEALDAGIPISSGTIRRGIQDFGTQRALREFDRLPRTMKPEGMGRRQAIERMAQ